MKRDQWGYPHIWVNDINEGAYARGYMHATDRLVQVHIALMLGQGRMMELLGDIPVARMLDRATRGLDFVSDLDTHARRFNEPTKQLLEAYCDGFNRGVADRSYPLVLRAMGLSPLKMTLENILLMYRFVSYFGLSSMHHLAEGVVAQLIGEGISTEGLSFLLGDALGAAKAEDFAGMSFPEAYAFLQPPPSAGGSNAFAVSAERSGTDGALVMGEFHMEVGRFPPILYAVHCEYKDGNYYSGVGIPGLAWLSAGRTRDIGWSYTFGHAENIDIKIETCQDGCYQVEGGWQPLHRRVEVVFIKDKEPERWTFYDNPYGTVLGNAMQPGQYPCVRWSGLRDHTAGDINAVRDAMVATNVQDFQATHRHIRMLSLAAVVADTQGNIGYIQTGQVDERPPEWPGVAPHPAHPSDERSPQPLPESTRPFSYNPPEGFIVSANERTDGPDGTRWCMLPEPPYRHQRITELLQHNTAPTLDDLVAISYDEVDLCARQLLAIWEPYLPNHPAAKGLCQWAKHQSSPATEQDRQQMSLFYALHYEMTRHLLARYIPMKQADALLQELGLLVVFQHHMDPVLALKRPELLDGPTLRQMLQRLWPLAQGRVKSKEWTLPPRAPFKNAITQGQLPTWMGFSSAPIDLPGSPMAPFQSRIVNLKGQTMVAGPVFHVCFDMSQPYGWYNIAGGASEQRLGPGYGKGLEAWRDGTFAPLGKPTGTPPSRNT
jgi:penicillin amidase